MTSFISGYISTLILNTLTLNIVLKILLIQRKGCFINLHFLLFFFNEKIKIFRYSGTDTHSNTVITSSRLKVRVDIFLTISITSLSS